MAGLFSLSFGSLRSLKRRTQKGATAVEMALIAPIFFMLMIGTIEGALILTAQQLMEHATFNTSRLAKTGFTASGQTQAQTVTQILNQELQSLGLLIDTDQVTMTSTAYTTFNMIGTPGQGTSGLGTPEQIVVYTVSYPWELFTPLMSSVMGTEGVLTLTSRIVVRNEPYN